MATRIRLLWFIAVPLYWVSLALSQEPQADGQFSNQIELTLGQLVPIPSDFSKDWSGIITGGLSYRRLLNDNIFLGCAWSGRSCIRRSLEGFLLRL